MTYLYLAYPQSWNSLSRQNRQSLHFWLDNLFIFVMHKFEHDSTLKFSVNVMNNGGAQNVIATTF